MKELVQVVSQENGGLLREVEEMKYALVVDRSDGYLERGGLS
jgi:hypothetical protein